jgi:uridine kinase
MLSTLADAIASTNPRGYSRVAIDGIDAAGKTRLADELAPLVEARGRSVIRSSSDAFLRPAAERYRQGRDSPRDYYEDSFNLAAIRRAVLNPPNPAGSVLLFDGVFLLRPELDECWDFRVFVRVSYATSLQRALDRDVPALGGAEEVRRLYENRYHPGQRLYLAEVRPEERAEAVLVNDDPANPGLILRR